MADMLCGQWYARACGLPSIDENEVRPVYNESIAIDEFPHSNVSEFRLLVIAGKHNILSALE
tara:strand:- start:1109 stop:1294 length:186 start_codon:yes stop_codon:yes gene_type:complete